MGGCKYVTFTFPFPDDWTEGTAARSSFGQLILDGFSHCTLSLNEHKTKRHMGTPFCAPILAGCAINILYYFSSLLFSSINSLDHLKWGYGRYLSIVSVRHCP